MILDLSRKGRNKSVTDGAEVSDNVPDLPLSAPVSDSLGSDNGIVWRIEAGSFSAVSSSSASDTESVGGGGDGDVADANNNR